MGRSERRGAMAGPWGEMDGSDLLVVFGCLGCWLSCFLVLVALLLLGLLSCWFVRSFG